MAISVDKTNIQSKSTTVVEHFLSHPNHCHTDMQLIPLAIIHSSRDSIRKPRESFLGRLRLGIFRNKNVFRNIFRLFCSWEQNSQNGIQVFRNENSSQTNAYLHYSNYSYSGLIPNERALNRFMENIETSRYK